MKTLKLSNITLQGTEEALNDAACDILRARDAFVSRYCAEKGWNREELTLTQIIEIRKCPEWIDPEGNKQ